MLKLSGWRGLGKKTTIYLRITQKHMYVFSFLEINILKMQSKLLRGHPSGEIPIREDLTYRSIIQTIALTQMALSSDGTETHYIEHLLNEYGSYSSQLLKLCTAEYCVGFLSELGQEFNGNAVDATNQRKDHLESILNSLLG